MQIKKLIVGSLVIFALGCAARKPYTLQPPIAEENDDGSIAKPKAQKVSLYEDAIENVFGREIDEFAKLPAHLRKLTNNYKQAKNVNALDEVPNSSWFTNRHAQNPMTIEELQCGPNSGAVPDTSGPLTIVAAKVEGVSPGCRIKDQKGEVYFVKFDFKGFPQLSTAAEVISTKFTYAAGYNTPENYLSVIDPKKLQIAGGVTVKNRWGREVPMTMEFVQQLLDKAHSNADGTYRIVASKALSGKPLGPFLYGNRRKDDPNDRVPHHHRRELRGYKVLAAWLNNFDSKASNTLDMYVIENDRSFVRHYLIDFGTSLGSGGYGPAGRSRGHRGGFDIGNMLLRILTLGLWVEPWEKQPSIISPSVGYFESKLFDPGDYAFIIPNPAFQRATERDGFWGAKLVMSFSDEQIRAIVETGEYQNRADEEYVIKTLIERRDKTGRYWYRKINPLDRFRVSEQEGRYTIEFDDLAVNAGFEQASTTAYRYRIEYRGKAVTKYAISKGQSSLPLSPEMIQAIEKQFKQKANLREEDQIVAVAIQTSRSGGRSWGKYVKVHFYFPFGNEKAPQVIALEREN